MSLHTKFKDQCLNVFHVTTCKWELPWCISKDIVYIYIYIPSGNLLHSYWKWQFSWLIFQLNMVDRSIVMWLFTRGYLSLSHDLPPTCSVKHTGFRLEAVPLIPGSQLIPQERCQWDKTTQGPHPFLFWGLCACDIYIYTHTLFFIVTHAIIIQVGWLVGRLVGWTTHSSSRGPQAQPPPADLRVSSGNVIAALPASFWWPSRTETGTIREERRKTKEDPAQSQEKATNELKSPTVTGHQPLAKHKSARPHPKHQPSATRSVEESTPPARKHHWDYAPQSLATPCH